MEVTTLMGLLSSDAFVVALFDAVFFAVVV